MEDLDCKMCCSLGTGDPSEEKTAKKKKKKKKKKGGGGGGGAGTGSEGGAAPVNTGGKKQTNPPSIPITELFPNKTYPIGQIMEYPTSNDNRTAKNRFTSEEAKNIESSFQEIYQAKLHSTF